MSRNGVDQFVGKMIVSDSFRAKVLGGSRQEAIQMMQRFGTDITREEEKMLMEIKADTQAEFASAIETWYNSHPEGSSSGSSETE